MLARPAWRLQKSGALLVCVCVCVDSLMTETRLLGCVCVCVGNVLHRRADRRSELLVQNLAWGPRCHAQRQCTLLLARLCHHFEWVAPPHTLVTVGMQSPCYLVSIASDLTKEQGVLIKAAWERNSPRILSNGVSAWACWEWRGFTLPITWHFPPAVMQPWLRSEEHLVQIGHSCSFTSLRAARVPVCVIPSVLMESNLLTWQNVINTTLPECSLGLRGWTFCVTSWILNRLYQSAGTEWIFFFSGLLQRFYNAKVMSADGFGLL